MAIPSTSIPEAVDEFFVNNVAEFKSRLQDLDDRCQQTGSSSDPKILDELTSIIHQSREDCRRLEAALGDDRRLIAETQLRFRREIAPWFDKSWYFDHAKTKPRGYPGDYMMLTAIYDWQIKSTGLAEAMDRYFLHADLARAVRSRLANVKNFMTNLMESRSEPLRILNVASGPGREFIDGFENVSVPVTLTCLDTDEEALAYLGSHIAADVANKIDFKPVCYNALKTASFERNIANFGRSDLIYSVGLCDYIPDRYMIRILEGWRQSLTDDGIVYVAFKDCTKYVAAEYQWHVDWHFFERTEDDCRQLFEQAGYDMENLEVFRDETGIIMNFISRNSSTSHSDSMNRGDDRVHVDAPHKLKGPHFAPKPKMSTVDDSTTVDS